MSHPNDLMRQVYAAAEAREVHYSENSPKMTVCVVVSEEDAYRIGAYIALHEARVAAFSAIRRAAEVARKNDCFCGGCPIAYRAVLIRRAIRAAIGSDKS